MYLLEAFMKDAVHVDFDNEIMYGSDQAYISCPIRFVTVRSVLHVQRDQGDEDIRIVKQIKNNLAPKGNDLRFEIRPDTGFKWLEAEENRAADTADNVFTELPKNKHELGAILLKKALADGPVESNEIKKLMVQYRIGDKTLNEVKNSLGIKPFRKMRVWYWALPGTVTGKSGSVENEIIVIRQFLKYLALSGETVFIPTIPKVHDDYVPYIFTDDEIARIIHSADRLTISEKKADPWLVVEFPVIIRLLYSCGLRLGETVRIVMKDVDLENGKPLRSASV